jgi:hypothetical protein
VRCAGTELAPVSDVAAGERALSCVENGTPSDGPAKRITRCGRWRFAPASDLTGERAEEIAGLLGVSGDLDLR